MWQNIIAGVILAAVLVAVVRWVVLRMRHPSGCENCGGCPGCSGHKRGKEKKTDFLS